MSATQILAIFVISILFTTVFLGRPLARFGKGTLKTHLLIATGITGLVFLNYTFEWGLQQVFITFMAAWVLLRFAFGAMFRPRFGQRTPFLFLIPAAIYTVATLGSEVGTHAIAILLIGGFGVLNYFVDSAAGSAPTPYRTKSNSQADHIEEQERFAAQARDWDERRQAEDDRWREIQEEKQRNYDEGERNIFHI